MNPEFEKFKYNANGPLKGKYIVVLGKDGMYVFNRDDNKFHTINNDNAISFEDDRLYIKAYGRSIMLTMIFHSLDEFLDYINAKRWMKDISDCLLQLKYNNYVNQ